MRLGLVHKTKTDFNTKHAIRSIVICIDFNQALCDLIMLIIRSENFSLIKVLDM